MQGNHNVCSNSYYDDFYYVNITPTHTHTHSQYSSQLKASRTHFLDLISKQTTGVDEMTVAFTEYLGLLRGLIDAPEGGESKLRTMTTFKWTNTLGGRTPRYK